jgi:tRNA nucleotidyltransferase (CCA-adding enzyme)
MSGDTVLARMRELPGGPQLLDLAAGREDVELVGGAARDLLLGLTPRELDVVVGADAASFAGDLASRLGLRSGADPDRPGATAVHERFATAVHERFGTALLSWEAGRIDIASRRAESYPAPGALPEVREGTPAEDLLRRDFTVNAIAVLLGGPRRGELRSAPQALEDLRAGRLRVLHERSFLDDPTRLFRLARYLSRLGFEPEERTAELAAEALLGGALASVSRARIGGELRLALTEPDPLAALGALSDVGVLSALQPRLELAEPLARRALQVLPEDGRSDLLLLACLLQSVPVNPGEDRTASLLELLDDLEFTAGERDRAIRTALLAPGLVGLLERVRTPSAVRETVRAAPLEAIALAASLAEEQGLMNARAGARRWLSEQRHVRLQITGDDLLAAGIPAGPEVGRRLAAALDMRLDGKLDDTPEAQLRAALDAPA